MKPPYLTPQTPLNDTHTKLQQWVDYIAQTLHIQPATIPPNNNNLQQLTHQIKVWEEYAQKALNERDPNAKLKTIITPTTPVAHTAQLLNTQLQQIEELLARN